MTTSVDALIFSGTTPGCLRYAYDKQKATWVELFPPQIDRDDEKGFAAYGYKNGTAMDEYYEFETGADDKMEDYYNVKRYGPKNGTLYDDLTPARWWEENGGYPNGSNICNQLKGNPGYNCDQLIFISGNTTIIHLINGILVFTYLNSRN